MGQVIHVGVGIVVSSDRNAVLTCRRRADDYWGGWWEFPGGKCQPGESPGDCTVRELREELGIDVDLITPLTPRIHHYADRDRTVHLHPYVCKLLGGQPAAIEVETFDWTPPQRLRELRFLPANSPIIDELLGFLSKEVPRSVVSGANEAV